jgi:hypothetical protein
MSFKERILNENTSIEEATKAFNLQYSKPIMNAAKKFADKSPIFSGLARHISGGIQANRDILAREIKEARSQGTPEGKVKANAMSYNTNPYSEARNHPTYRKLQKGGIFSAPKSDQEIEKIMNTTPKLFNKSSRTLGGTLAAKARIFDKDHQITERAKNKINNEYKGLINRIQTAPRDSAWSYLNAHNLNSGIQDVFK